MASNRPAGKSGASTRRSRKSKGTEANVTTEPKAVAGTEADTSAAAPATNESAPASDESTAAPATESTEAKPAEEKPPEPKCAMARIQKGRPHPNLLRIIAKKNPHPGRAFRIKRWERYEEGMSVLHCRVTEGLDHLDIGFYEKHGLMELRPMNEQELAVALERWEGKAVGAQPAATATTEGESAAAPASPAS